MKYIQFHYIYIDEYRETINKQNLNFINEYIFDFEDNKLTQSLNENYVENIYGFTKSVNVIVGKNGTGKTSLFNSIIQIFASKNYNQMKFIIVTKENGKFYCYVSENYKDIDYDTSFFEKSLIVFDKKAHSYFIDMYKTKNYFAGVFSNALYLNDYTNISNELADKGYDGYKEYSYTTKSLILKYGNYNVYNQQQNLLNINFLANEDEMILDKIFDFHFSKYLSLNINVQDDETIQTMKLYNTNIEYYDWNKFNEVKLNLNMFCNERASLFVRFCVLQNMVFDFISYAHSILSEPDKRLFKDIISVIEFSMQDNDFINCYLTILENIKMIELMEIAHKEEIMQKIRYLIRVGDVIKLNTYSYDNDEIELLPGSVNIKIDDLKELYKLYSSYGPKNDFLNIRWDKISSGQNALLNIYARLFDFFQKVKIHDNSGIFLFFDEIELYLHPEWQRKTIYLLLEYCNIKFRDACKNLQLFFATNSPFSLSDIVLHNVLFLKEKNYTDSINCKTDLSNHNTFGKNIHELLKYNFFMDYTIGEFSKNYINDLIYLLSPIKKKSSWKYPNITSIKTRLKKRESTKNIKIHNWDDLAKRIEIIGDRMIKEKIFDMLYMCMYGGNKKEDYLKRLEEKKMQIEKQIRSLKEGGINDSD